MEKKPLVRRYYPILDAAKLSGLSLEEILELAATEKLQLYIDGTNPLNRKAKSWKKVPSGDIELTLRALPKFEDRSSVLIQPENGGPAGYEGYYAQETYTIKSAVTGKLLDTSFTVQFCVRDLWLQGEALEILRQVLAEGERDFRRWLLEGKEISVRNERQARILKYLWETPGGRSSGFHEGDILKELSLWKSKDSRMKTFFNNEKDAAWKLLEKTERAHYRLRKEATPLSKH